MQLVILASGKGSRLKNKTKNIPKCLVKINGKSIIDYNKKIFSEFKNIIIITGYKSKLIEEKFKNKKISFIKNKNFKTTNMVYSFFCASRCITKSVLICYADIIFNHKILHLLKKNHTSIVVKKNWFSYWKKRMSYKDIFDDAENITIKKNYVESIGGKINKNNIPRNQFMGIIKITLKDFKKLKKFFFKLKSYNIDFTSFLDLALKNKVIRLKAIETKLFWLEIDTIKDLKYAEKKLN